MRRPIAITITNHNMSQFLALAFAWFTDTKRALSPSQFLCNNIHVVFMSEFQANYLNALGVALNLQHSRRTPDMVSI